MIEQAFKKEILGKYQRHTFDTGSPEVQIAILSARIQEIMMHLKPNKKDKASTRGLQKLVAKRKKHMKYLSRKNPTKYQQVISELGIRG